MNRSKTKQNYNKIILGIDPGTRVMGYGVIQTSTESKSATPLLLRHGVIHLSKYSGHALKLKKIFERMLALIDEFHPDEMALEAPFYGKNVQSMLKLGRAQGVAMSAALSREIPICEYAPKKVKQSVTGNGNASKEQVAEMMKNLLIFPNAEIIIDNQLLDATDALAVALCHHYHQGQPQQRGKQSWKAFVEGHPGRVI
jgi:crossover junction endodeoxyribonuclease RuvC